MESKKENIKSLFSNARSRLIILLTAGVILLAMLVGYLKFSSITKEVTKASSSLASSPDIQSTPGSKNPTQQYAKLQETQNVEQAKDAIKTGDSAIPTIIRTQAFGKGIEAVGPKNGEGGLGFSALRREDQDGPEQSLWLQSLKNADCSRTAVQKVVAEGGGLSILRKACSCLQLKDNGYDLEDLETVCACKELKAAGFNARQLKNADYSATRLRHCGFDACELKSAGFTAQQMKDAGFSNGELKGAGFTKAQIQQAGGLPDGITGEDVRKAGCSLDGLEKLRESGVSASAVRRINGCSAGQLKAAGYTAAELRHAGFTAAELKRAGFTPAELRDAGYNARDLLNAGFTPKDLAEAGFTPAEIKTGEAELPPGITSENVKDAGCSLGALKRERAAGISAMLIHRYAGCSAKALKESGFTNDDLANAGFTPKQIKAADQVADVDDAAIHAAGCDVDKLKMLHKEGVSATQIRKLNKCSAAALKAAGYDAKDLVDAGFTPKDLSAAGFSSDQIKAAEKSAVGDGVIHAAGCDVDKLKALREEGVSAARIRKLNGCSAEVLKAAGYDARELANAGFTPKQLLAAGFTPTELKAAGLNPSGAIAAGRVDNCSVSALRAAHKIGVSATTIRHTLGCSAAAMKAAGYTAKELKAAGYTAAELKNAGFTAAELKAAGFSAKQLKDAGFTAAELKDAGFSAKQLKAAGFSANQLQDAGFSANQLKDAGFDAAQLKAAGYSAADLKKAGFSASQLKDAGYTANQLKAAGYSPTEIREAGFETPPSEVAGLADHNSSASGGTTLPSLSSASQGNTSVEVRQAAENAKRLQKVLSEQKKKMAEQQYKQNIQQQTGQMLSVANQELQAWKAVSTQVLVAGTSDDTKPKASDPFAVGRHEGQAHPSDFDHHAKGNFMPEQAPIVKAGDVLFAVLDSSVNSDQPGPILATIVSGRLKGSKLIGSFNLPSNSDKMVITFNTVSVPGVANTLSINAYAIDPSTGRTALASRSNHHYLLRYGSLFASTFLEGFGNAFQSANTTVTIGGSAGNQSTTIQNGVGRSILENAVIGLSTVGKSWAQVAQRLVDTPTTVVVYSGTPLGILFTQNVSLTTKKSG